MTAVHLHTFNPWCVALGSHHWHWDTDTVACSRRGCHHTSAKRTEAFLAEFSSAEAFALLIDEANRAEMGTTTDCEGGW